MSEAITTIFEEDEPRAALGEGLVLDLKGFEGPIDVLLQLARDQKVDLKEISILELAEQYLVFVQEARRVRLELAADYLVMAAWLAFLKSKLLLPEPEEEGEEPTGAAMAAALAFQLQRLEAMQEAGRRLFDRGQLGRDVFARGEPERVRRLTTTIYDVSLFELLRAYGQIRGRADEAQSLRILKSDLWSIDEAMERLRRLVGASVTPGWQTLNSFLPPELRDSLVLRSAVATTLSASLELCKQGKLDIRQDGTFGPIYLRAAERPEETTEGPAAANE